MVEPLVIPGFEVPQNERERLQEEMRRRGVNRVEVIDETGRLVEVLRLPQEEPVEFRSQQAVVIDEYGNVVGRVDVPPEWLRPAITAEDLFAVIIIGLDIGISMLPGIGDAKDWAKFAAGGCMTAIPQIS